MSCSGLNIYHFPIPNQHCEGERHSYISRIVTLCMLYIAYLVLVYHRDDLLHNADWNTNATLILHCAATFAMSNLS